MGRKTNKIDTEYPFEHGEVIHYTLDGVSLHIGWCINTPSHYKDTGGLPNLVTREEGNLLRDLNMRPMVTLKQFKFSGCERRKLRMDQHCSYSTILT